MVSSGAVSSPLGDRPASRLQQRATGISRRRSLGTLGPLGLYLILSLAFFGPHVVLHMGTRLIASDPIDSSQFTWFLAWWPHAILDGLNPFVTHAMFVPDGFNLTWSTAMPGPAILLSPITLLFGPVVTYNVIQLASPALTAWTMFLLCRHVTGRVWPALAGGYLFGFSAFELTHLTGGPYLALAAVLPLIVLLILRRMAGTISAGWFVIAMALCMIGQFSISSETLVTAGLFGAVALVLAFILGTGGRPAILDVVRLLIAAAVITGIVLSPFLYFFFFGHQYPPGATYFPADLTGYLIPPPLVALAHHAPASTGSADEAYLGLPLILLVLVFILRRWRQPTTWVLSLTMLAALVCSLGSGLVVHGHATSLQLPWNLIGRLPVLRYAIPLRMAEFVVLIAALIAAMCIADTRLPAAGALLSCALGLAAIVAIIPVRGSANWLTPAQDPAFFANGAYRHYLRSSDNVLTWPAWGPNERWQANTGFRFRLSDGYAGNPFPPSYSRYPIWLTLTGGALTPHYGAELRRFIVAKRVTAIVVDATAPGPWPTLFRSLGARPQPIGGVLYYRLRFAGR